MDIYAKAYKNNDCKYTTYEYMLKFGEHKKVVSGKVPSKYEDSEEDATVCAIYDAINKIIKSINVIVHTDVQININSYGVKNPNLLKIAIINKHLNGKVRIGFIHEEYDMGKYISNGAIN